MNKNLLGFAIIAFSFVIGYSINNIAVSNPEYRIAIVDTQKIANNSSDIKALKAEQTKQIEKIINTIDKARFEISEEKNLIKAAQLEEKYQKEIQNQKIALKTAYDSKLTAIDNKIKTAVVEKARSMNYNIVLSKDNVLFGGDDITEDVLKIIE